MRNPYAKSVKFFSKCEDLFICRNDHVVYISDGHVIEKMHVAAYDAFFRPASGQFLEMNGGDRAARRGAMNLPEKGFDAFDLVTYFEDYKAKAAELVTVSPFLMEFTDARGKNALQRMFTGAGYYVAVNNAFFEIAKEVGFASYWSTGGSVAPITANSGDNGILILPIRLDQQRLDSFLNVAK